MSGVTRLLFALIFAIGISGFAKAQYTVQHQPPTVLNKASSNQLEFILPAVNPTDVLDAYLFYRNEGDLSYSQIEIQYVNGAFVGLIPPEILTGSSFEYYFQLTLNSINQDIFYPDNVPAENPVSVEVVDAPDEIGLEPDRPKAEGIDYTIISPRQGNGLAPADAYVAISLYYDRNAIVPGEFRLYLNGLDVTENADTSAYFISYTPKNLERGDYNITLDYVTDAGPLEVTSWNFRIVRPGQANFKSFGPTMIPSGRVELTARNQVISGNLNNAFTGRSFITGGYGKFKYTLSGFLTSQESDRLQPQNRVALGMNLGKWWNFEAGHVFPNMGRFTISGRRIYGVNTSMHLLWENVNVQFLHGELSRRVTNLYDEIEAEDVFASAESDSVVDRNYTLTYQEGGRGTFTRKITGGRVALGNPRFFQLGVQAMKVEDDTTSIFNAIDYADLQTLSSSESALLFQNLTIADQVRLDEQPDLLRVQGGSPRPKGNFVAGADLKFAFDKNRIRFRTETVASVLNNDIYGGPLDSIRAADLGFEGVNPDNLNILDQIAQVIIINENVNVLPIRVKGFGTDSSEIEPFFPTGILGHNTEFSAVYPKNNFSLQYRWVGPEFVSLANSTIRKDIAGFTALDRFRLFQNQVYVTLGYESLTDNVSRSKEATTRTNSIRSNVSWYPRKAILPRVSIGYRYRTRDNGIARFNSAVPVGLEQAAVQNLKVEDGDTLTTTTPRLNNTTNLSFSVTQQVPLKTSVHDATISLTALNTEDEVFAFGDVKNTSFSFSVASRFSSLPLRTQVGMSVNNTESGSGQLNIDIFGMYVGGSYFFMDGRLNVNGRFAFTSNSSTSRVLEIRNAENNSFLDDYYELSPTSVLNEFSTFVMLAGAEYKLAEKHSLVFNSNFTNVSGNNALNDRVVQLRYIYRF
jgi:hypothetical protein